MIYIEKESTTDSYNKIDDFHMYYADREKTFTNQDIQWDYILKEICGFLGLQMSIGIEYRLFAVDIILYTLLKVYQIIDNICPF